MADEQLDTHRKALSLNLDPTIFGSFAEIGAGQEVARWFLQVGGASGTVAKTISAYDKEVSDNIYGSGTRYVSQQRLEAMLEQEWRLLQMQVAESRRKTQRFFAFADSVSARNFAGTNECHGWVGLRFQATPEGEANDVLLHVNLMDPANLLQQEALGILGVNLVYAAFHQRQDGRDLLQGLAAAIGGRIEIDLIVLRGPVFAAWDARLIHVQLVQDGLAQAVVFSPDGVKHPPTEILHKRAVVLAAGAFEGLEPLDEHRLAAALAQLRGGVDNAADNAIGLFNLATDPPTEETPSPSAVDLLERVDARLRQGADVLLSRHPELYRTTSFVNRFTQADVRVVVSLPTLIAALEDARYRHLEGRILEGIARLFAQNVKLYAYPAPVAAFSDQLQTLASKGWTVAGSSPWLTADQLQPPSPIRHLYAYLLASGFLVALQAPVG